MSETANFKQAYRLIDQLSLDTNSKVYVSTRDSNLVFQFQRNNLFVEIVISRRERHLYMPIDVITENVNNRFREMISHE